MYGFLVRTALCDDCARFLGNLNNHLTVALQSIQQPRDADLVALVELSS